MCRFSAYHSFRYFLSQIIGGLYNGLTQLIEIKSLEVWPQFSMMFQYENICLGEEQNEFSQFHYGFMFSKQTLSFYLL